MRNLNLPILPSGWVIAKVAAIAQVNPPLDRCIIKDSVEIDFVPMRAVEPNGGGLLRPEVSTYGDVKKGYTPFLSGDVIMAKITPCMENGKTCLVPTLPGAACFGSTEFHVVRPDWRIDARWVLNFLLQHSTRQAAQRQMAGGVGQMRVPASFLESLELPVPPSAEQRRTLDLLEELLSDLDAAVKALERVRRKLKHYRAAVLKEAVEGGLTADWRVKHPNIEPASRLLQRILSERRQHWERGQLKRFKASGRVPGKNWRDKYREPSAPDITNLPALPTGWCWASLDQLAEIVGGVTKGQKLSPNDKTREVPYLRVANVQRGYLDLTEMKKIPALEDDIKALKLVPGDILFNEGGDRDKLGRGWIWEGKIAECIHQNHVFRARLFLNDVRAKLVSWCGNSYGQRWFMRTGKQSVNLASINMTVLRSFPIPLSPVAEQDVIVDAVEGQLSVIDHLEADLDSKLKSAQALRESIFGHTFGGQLLPQDARDEPAAKLIERIAAERAANQRTLPSNEGRMSRRRPAPLEGKKS